MHYRIDPQRFGPLFTAWRRRKARDRRSSWLPEQLAIGELSSNVGIRAEKFYRAIAGNLSIGEIALVKLAEELNCPPKNLILRRNGLREFAVRP